MARVRTRSGLRLLQVLLAVLAAVGVVLAIGGFVQKQLLPLIEGASLAVVALACIPIAGRRFRRHRPRTRD